MHDDRPSTTTIEIHEPLCEGIWVLELQDRSGARRVPLTGTLVVGSAPPSDVVVDDPTVSQSHCRLSGLGGGVEVVDLGSRNGTYVGGARIERAWASSGTALTIGQTTIVLERSLPSSRGPSSVKGTIASSTVTDAIVRSSRWGFVTRMRISPGSNWTRRM